MSDSKSQRDTFSIFLSKRITEIDPIKHNLIFERFLNEDRISMPDIDIDFCIERRGEVIDYIKNQYGENSVTQIITFGKMKAKQVVRDVGRVMGYSFGEVDKIECTKRFEHEGPLFRIDVIKEPIIALENIYQYERSKMFSEYNDVGEA